jgi:hypothetical protein
MASDQVKRRRSFPACLFGLVMAAALSLPVGAADGPTKPVDAGQQKALQELLAVMDQLVIRGPKDSLVYQGYQTVRTQMQAARIMFVVDAKSTNTSLLQSAYFSPNRNGVSWIVVDPVLVATAKTRPGLALTILMNALAMASSFFEDPAHFASLYQDPVGSFLFSMDALYLQAMFARDFVKPNFPALGAFEQYLVDSLSYENMASSALFILGVDQNVVYGMNAMEADIRAKKLESGAWLARISAMVKEIHTNLDKARDLNAVPEDGGTADDSAIRTRTRYIAVISGLTMLKYGVGIMTVQLPLFEKAQQDKIKPELVAFNKSLESLDAKITALSDPAQGRVMDYRKNLLTGLGL